MTDELRETMDALRAITPDLNAAGDEANRAVEVAERLLEGVGISARSDCFDDEYAPNDRRNEGDDEGGAPVVSFYLAYGRVVAAYTIHVVEETTVPDVDDRGFPRDKVVDIRKTPWGGCSRETRLQAIEMLPQLLGKIAKIAQRQVKKANQATKTVRDLGAAIEGSQASPKPNDKARAKAKPSAD